MPSIGSDSRAPCRFSDEATQALSAGGAVVTLESTVIAHGLPPPFNLNTALACKQGVREEGAVPATIGIVSGVATIGLDEAKIATFASGRAPDDSKIEKVNLSNLAAIMASRSWGATTVAASMRIATLGGLSYDQEPHPLVFSTGGIGGVHRGASDSFDISADLTALGSTQIICVCAGAKAVLDLPKTVEALETLGVPIIGYQTEEFPAFYSRSSGLPVDATARTPDRVAEIAISHWRTGARTAVLVCVPIPDQFELPLAEVEMAVKDALESATRAGIRGKVVTPFLLSRMEKLTGGDTLTANRALLVNNAIVAAQIAMAVANLTQRR
ncbi:MAG TPA: pseudouridine-5'-phosphate glycosidase [Blastocatellia bacterium]|nr:pseudouridine-5'-phosphate glycosidase [Blastocatellia bacterium]